MSDGPMNVPVTTPQIIIARPKLQQIHAIRYPLMVIPSSGVMVDLPLLKLNCSVQRRHQQAGLDSE